MTARKAGKRGQWDDEKSWVKETKVTATTTIVWVIKKIEGKQKRKADK